jgi:hypothetical protein
MDHQWSADQVLIHPCTPSLKEFSKETCHKYERSFSVDVTLCLQECLANMRLIFHELLHLGSRKWGPM